MASKRILKKKVKQELDRLEFDLRQYMSLHAESDQAKINEILANTQQLRQSFIAEFKVKTKRTSKYFIDLVEQIIVDIDKNYNLLKDLIDNE